MSRFVKAGLPLGDLVKKEGPLPRRDRNAEEVLALYSSSEVIAVVKLVRTRLVELRDMKDKRRFTAVLKRLGATRLILEKYRESGAVSWSTKLATGEVVEYRLERV